MLKRSAAACAFLLTAVYLSFGIEPTKDPTDYSKEAFVLEQSFDKFKFENDGTSTREIRAAIRIQSDAGVQHFSVLKFAYQKSSESFAIDYIRVTKSNGTQVPTQPDDFQDMPADLTRQAPFYSDTHELHVAVKGMGIGDLLEYQVHWQHNKPLVPGQFWLEYILAHSGIVLNENVEISVPRGRAIKLQSATKPALHQAAGYDVYLWTNSNLTNKSDKDKKQESQEQAWQQVRGRLPKPEIVLSSFQNWEEVGKWYGDLQRDKVKPSAEVESKAKELTKGLEDNDAKIRALYNFVSTRYRYIGIDFGIGRYQPHSAAEVLENEYGDCKDKHTLLASLLSAIGIKTYPALISSAHELDKDVPSPGQFDHVITAIPRTSGYLWLDTTAEVAPLALLVPPLRAKEALVIPDNGPPLFATTPSDAPFPSLQKFEMQAKLNDAGVLEGQVQETERGDSELIFRAAFRAVPIPQWKDFVQRVSFGMGFAGDVSDVNATQPEKTAEPFHFTYSYKRKDYSDWSNRRITPPLPVISLPEIDDDITPKAPIWLGSPGEIDFRSTLELPKEYLPELPKATHIKKDFADYDATYSFNSGILTAERHIVIKLREIPLNEYLDYKSFRKAITDDYDNYTLLSPRGTSWSATSYQNEIWNLPYSHNAEAARLYDDARAQFQRNDMQGEIASLKQAVEIDQQFVRAWLWLGEIYKASRQNDLALQAYRRAIEIDPDEPVSYQALGFSLTALGKEEEAIPIWQQLAKIAPERPEGYFNWGSGLLKLKRYQDAISPLEAAVKVSPEQASLQLTLGLAYLNTGNIEKSRSAFDAALKLDSSTVMYNDIAYELAEKGTDLDRAKVYADRAVQEEEKASTTTQISALQTSDLDRPRRLAMFWDTLGWVYFRLNQFIVAEKYLSAAWALSQSPVIGEHLGRAYEQQGKKQTALRTYQLAHLASPLKFRFPVPGAAPVTNRSTPEIEADIRRLGGVPESAKFMADLNQMRSVKLPRLSSGTATAEFFVLLGPGAKIETKFISGSDSLKSAGKALESAKFNEPFPDDHGTVLLRRGVLGCYQYTGCSFVLMTPDTVFSLQ